MAATRQHAIRVPDATRLERTHRRRNDDQKVTMAIGTRTSNAHYERRALADSDRKWELWDGYLREKPGMTAAHSDLAVNLGSMLLAQLDRTKHRVRIDAGRVHRPEATYFVPDLFVVPTSMVAALLPLTETLEVYDQPLPLVVEIWSRSTGGYVVTEKLAVYQERGDREI
ncbi:MAG: Uma2 family endonuclease [Thermomicrobiales bacterium]